jgi:predicted ATPase
MLLCGRDSAVLVEKLIGNAGLSRDIVDELIERTDGVPLFVEELTKAVLEGGERDNRLAVGSLPKPVDQWLKAGQYAAARFAASPNWSAR